MAMVILFAKRKKLFPKPEHLEQFYVRYGSIASSKIKFRRPTLIYDPRD